MKIFLFIFFLLSINTIYSQDGYTWLNPIPTSIFIHDIEFISSNIGWVAGYEGTIIKTTDGGDTWNHQFASSEYILKISFLNENIGIAVGDQGLIVKTTNGGATWEKKNLGLGKRFFGADLIDENTYVVVGRGITKSIDGGKTWIEKYSSYSLYDVVFYNASIGIAVGDNGFIVKTTNGGNTWNGYRIATSGAFRKVFFLDENNLIITGPKVMRSSDKGETWFALNVDSTIRYNDIYFKDLNNGVILSDGKILKTTDGGFTWITDTIAYMRGPEYYYSRELGYLNDSTFVVAGGPGRIVKTTNAGTTWELKTKGFFDDITKVNFLNEKDGFVVCRTGSIYKTTNAGDDWIKLNIENTQPLENISFLDEKNGVVVGNGIILLTSDGGTNWDIINQPYYDILAVQYIDEKNIVCVSHNALLKTSDKGSTWDINFVPKNDIIGIHFKDVNNGIIFGFKNLIKTTDGGSNWELLDLVPGEDDTYYRALFKNETGYIKVNSQTDPYNQFFMKTVDGGANWERVSTPIVGIMAMYNESTISIYNGAYSYTTINGGTTWYKTNTLYNDIYYLTDFNLVSAQQAYLVGNGGRIVKINPMFIPTGVELFNTIPQEFSLTQNYPNPFNPTTKINYTLAKDGRASLIIYDVLGREVKKLFDEEKSKGTYTIEFNGNELSSGIYFYRLQTDGYSETKKMVLLK